MTMPCQRSLRFSVQALWEGDKGTDPCQFVFYPLPPPGLDGYGVWFTQTNPHTLWIANANQHCLLRVNLRTRATETFGNPLAPAFRMVGGCPYQGGLALLMRPARGNLPAQIVRWVSAKRLLTLTSLPEDVPLPPPIWLRFHRQRNSWLCAHRGVQINGEVPKTSLYEYSDQTGQLLREIPELAGAALGSGGALYVGGAGASSEGVVRVAPPEGLDSQRWLLVGVDAKERLYWYSQERTGRWNISHLACSTRAGRLLWQTPLTGSEGVLEKVDPQLRVRLGWGCEWLEVSADGSIVMFAWSGSEKVQKGVGVYQVRWQGD